jgi:hypothetical protein
MTHDAEKLAPRVAGCATDETTAPGTPTRLNPGKRFGRSRQK